MPRAARARNRVEALVTEAATPVSIQEMAEILGLSVSAVQRAIGTLVAEDVVVVTDETSPTGGYLYRAKTRKRPRNLSKQVVRALDRVPNVGDLYRVVEVRLHANGEAIDVVLRSGERELMVTLPESPVTPKSLGSPA